MKNAFLIAAVLVCRLCLPAAAFHPFLTEESGPIGRNVNKTRVLFEHSVSRNGPDVHTNTLNLEYGYGISDGLDFIAAVPWIRWTSAGASQSGYGDLELSSKFYLENGKNRSLALMPGFSLPTGDEEKGLGNGRSQAWLTAIVGIKPGRLHSFFNVSYLYNDNSGGERKHLLSASVAAAYELTPGWLPVAELSVGMNPEKGDATPPASMLLGFVWEPVPWLDLQLGAKTGISGPAEGPGLLAGAAVHF